VLLKYFCDYWRILEQDSIVNQAGEEGESLEHPHSPNTILIYPVKCKPSHFPGISLDILASAHL